MENCPAICCFKKSLITYTADKTSDLKNGDEIKITAELPAQAAEEGDVLKEREKTVKVESLDISGEKQYWELKSEKKVYYILCGYNARSSRYRAE